MKKDKSGRWYKVDESGTRVIKGQRQDPDLQRPKDITTDVWFRVYNTDAKKREYWKERRAKEAADKGVPPPPPADAAPCAPLGIFGLLSDKFADVAQWAKEQATAAAAWLHTDEDDSTIEPESDCELRNYDVDDPDDLEPPWEAWERFIDEERETAELAPALAAAAAYRAAHAEAESGGSPASCVGCGGSPAIHADAPAMPARMIGGSRRGRERHRPKNAPRLFPFNAMVARPVGKNEIAQKAKAKAAMDAEWKKLRDKYVWDEDIKNVRDWSDVAREARDKGIDVHLGWLFGICVEKGSELEENNPNRKYKGRVVFQGNRVINQNWEAAMFQDMGSSPATMDASRAADCWGCCPNHDIEMADAEQAYVQAPLRGTETWVALPDDQIPAEWWKLGFKRPVCRLKRALHGHPDAGTM